MSNRQIYFYKKLSTAPGYNGIAHIYSFFFNCILIIAFILTPTFTYGDPGKRTYRREDVEKQMETSQEYVIQEGEVFHEEPQVLYSEKQDPDQEYSERGLPRTTGVVRDKPEKQLIQEKVSYISSCKISQNSSTSFAHENENEKKLLPEYEYEMERLRENRGRRDRSRNRLPLELESRLLEAQKRIEYLQGKNILRVQN